MKLINKLQQQINISEADIRKVIKIEVTKSNNAHIQDLFSKEKNNKIEGEIKNATYTVFLTGVKKGSLGILNVEIRTGVDSPAMMKKFEKEIRSKLRL